MKLAPKDHAEKTKKEKKSRLWKAKIILTVTVLAGAGAVTSFGVYATQQNEAYNKRITFDDNTAAKLNGQKVSMAEFMLYSVDIKNGYEKQYGTDIWTQKKKNAYGKTETYEKIAKEDILEQIRFVWALNKEGKKKNISLSKGEEKTLNETAKEYEKELKKAGVDTKVVTYDTIKQFYKENYYAQKVFYKLSGKNSVTEKSSAASGSSIVDTSSGMTTEEAQKWWTKLTDKWYPDFDYDLDINWTLLDQIKFDSTSAKSSSDGITSESGSESTEKGSEKDEDQDSSSEDTEDNSDTESEDN